LTNLAKCPASTVQILGAEKALFRALKTKGNTPKYGLIYHSTFIGRADAKNKGRISRYLANKCSIATRIDSFADEPTSVYGQKLRDQVEERLKFYETGAAPRKNIDVMEEVARHLKAGKDAEDEEMDEAEKKKKKKDKKKRKSEAAEEKEEEVKVCNMLSFVLQSNHTLCTKPSYNFISIEIIQEGKEGGGPRGDTKIIKEG
jgi:nucleolar protein 56